jgi:hypothetical protein
MNSCLLGDLQRMDPGQYRIVTSYTDPYRVYAKASEVNCPTPSDTWIFCDETMYSLNDGYLQMQLKQPDYPDIPAKYDCGGNCFSFVDGHVEYRKWRFFTNIKAGLPQCPYTYDRTEHGDGFSAWPSSGLDVDWLWLRDHTSCLPP